MFSCNTNASFALAQLALHDQIGGSFAVWNFNFILVTPNTDATTATLLGFSSRQLVQTNLNVQGNCSKSSGTSCVMFASSADHWTVYRCVIQDTGIS
jgi:hypothetical protein